MLVAVSFFDREKVSHTTSIQTRFPALELLLNSAVRLKKARQRCRKHAGILTDNHEPHASVSSRVSFWRYTLIAASCRIQVFARLQTKFKVLKFMSVASEILPVPEAKQLQYFFYLVQ